MDDVTQIGFAPEQIEQLNQKLDASAVFHRDGAGGRKLAYIEAATSIAHANRIFGYGRWGYHVTRQEVKKSCSPDGTITGIYFETDVEIMVVGAAFPFPGCGAHPVAPPFGPVEYENARKASVRDAVKLGLVNYGEQFGLSLYLGEGEVEYNGTVVPVNVIPIHEKGKQQKRIVESGKPAAKALPAAKPEDVPSVDELIAFCDRLFGAGRWEAAKERVFKVALADGSLTLEDRARVHHAFLSHEAKVSSAGGGR